MWCLVRHPVSVLRFELSSLNGSNGFRLDDDRSRLSFNSVSNAGDVNGDGFDDLIVGDSFGKASGLVPRWSCPVSMAVMVFAWMG
jgi:hypothetical protein